MDNGLLTPFGLPPMTLRRMLSVGLQEAQQIANPRSAIQPRQGQASGTTEFRSAKDLRHSQTSGVATEPPAVEPPSASSSTPPGLPQPALATVEQAHSDAPPTPSSLLTPPSGSRFVVREYVYRIGQLSETGKPPPSPPNPPEQNHPVALLYWHPFFLIGPEGGSQCRFDLPEQPGTFRIRADLLAPEGHMDLVETKIVSQPTPSEPGPRSPKPSASAKHPKTP